MSVASLELVVPVAVFTVVVVLLSLLVLAAREWLAPGGAVEIVVNGQRRFTASAGERLLGTLARHDIFLPAACGGQREGSQIRNARRRSSLSDN